MKDDHPPSDQPRLSPLAFTRDYQAYRDASGATPFADTRLLLAARFWMAHPGAMGSETLATFWREDLPPLLASVDGTGLDDLAPEELEEIGAFLDEVRKSVPQLTGAADLRSGRVWELAARKWFYLGETERAVARSLTFTEPRGPDVRQGLSRTSPPRAPDVRQGLPGTSPSSATPRETNPDQGQGHELGDVPPANLPEIAPDTPLPDVPAILAEALRPTNPGLAQWLARFAASWQAQRELGDPRRARCLLVEYDTNGQPVRGRMRTLEGKVDLLKGGTDTDEVIFDHQVRAPDDPFVGTVYGALAALRNLRASPREFPRFKSGGLLRRVLRTGAQTGDGPRYRGRFTMHGGGGEIYGGDSIGVAAFAVAYGDWWGSELHRERKLIGDTVAFTGAIDAEGGIRAIAGDSLTYKLVRALHSPVEYVVIPEANRAEAEACLAQLRNQYPRRRLRLIGIERPGDIIADYNILRPEKLCPSEYAVRTVAKLTRSVKVQVPILLALLYMLICLVYPKAWVGFDWNPSSVQLTDTGFIVLNSDGRELWHREFACGHLGSGSKWALGQVDGDDRLEVALLFEPKSQMLCDTTGMLFVYDDDGSVLFMRSCVIRDEYPGDSVFPQSYNAATVDFIERGSDWTLVTAMVRSSPARTHFRFWSTEGDTLGWYINAGYAGRRERYISVGNPPVFYNTAYNNRLSSVCLLAIRPDSCSGASPPYQDSEYDLTRVERGRHTAYLLFPPTDFCQARGSSYNITAPLSLDSPGVIRVRTDEFGGPRAEDSISATVSYFLDLDCNVLYVQCSDKFRMERDILVEQGALPPVDWREYEIGLAGHVKHWADTGWIADTGRFLHSR